MKNELSREMTGRILQEMKTGVYADVDRLPPEVDLAKQLGISRTMVRDCLSILEREGFINRKHGVGTVINRHVLRVTTRMDMEKEFLDMVRDAGYEPGTAWCKCELMPANTRVAARLAIAPGDDVYRVSRVVTADGKPAIYCLDYIGAHLVRYEHKPETLLARPIFDFLEEACEVKVTMDVTEVSAKVADTRLSEILGVPVGAPILYMDEVDYDLLGTPVLYSREYHVNGVLHHAIIRKKM